MHLTQTQKKEIFEEHIVMLKHFGCLGFKVIREKSKPYYFRVTVANKRGITTSAVGRNKEEAYTKIFRTIKTLRLAGQN